MFKVSARGSLCSKNSGCKRCADATKTAGIPRGIASIFAAGVGNAADAVFAGAVQLVQRAREETLNTLLERVQSLCARAVVFEKLWLLGEKRRDTSWYREYF